MTYYGIASLVERDTYRLTYYGIASSVDSPSKHSKSESGVETEIKQHVPSFSTDSDSAADEKRDRL